ncbi:hypothetical protein GH714_009961 [Hevea brasiliensis]|uniref:Uncharacterized protein n=1 Tax=Hevea brasiliensis TaxID=3981 RepID=A0A6A6MT47_HEVBR|nr:hypothetical protein GH714_009961 [Hevea brasiliensis]
MSNCLLFVFSVEGWVIQNDFFDMLFGDDVSSIQRAYGPRLQAQSRQNQSTVEDRWLKYDTPTNIKLAKAFRRTIEISGSGLDCSCYDVGSMRGKEIVDGNLHDVTLHEAVVISDVKGHRHGDIGSSEQAHEMMLDVDPVFCDGFNGLVVGLTLQACQGQDSPSWHFTGYYGRPNHRK